MASQAITMPSFNPGAKDTVAATSDAAASKPKPCCVCKDEKSKRDECMLFSTAADPQKDCQSTIDQYRSCMAGFGFKV
jgi:cytochrome c oxidase assembly protein subunit 17